MANVKISALSAAGAATATMLIPVVDGSTNNSLTVGLLRDFVYAAVKTVYDPTNVQGDAFDRAKHHGTMPSGAAPWALLKAGGTMVGDITFSGAGYGVLFNFGTKILDESTRAVVQASGDRFDVLSEDGTLSVFSVNYAAAAPTFKGNTVWHMGNFTPPVSPIVLGNFATYFSMRRVAYGSSALTAAGAWTYDGPGNLSPAGAFVSAILTNAGDTHYAYYHSLQWNWNGVWYNVIS